MRKALLLCLVVVALLVMASAAFAGDTISVTVTLQSVGVEVTPPTWDIGVIVPGGAASKACSAKNIGNVNEDFTIKTSNSTDWTAGATAGTNTFVIANGLTPLSGTPASLATAVVANASSPFTLNFTAPSAGSVITPQSFTVTVLAVAAS
jgi:hypothetical protein